MSANGTRLSKKKQMGYWPYFPIDYARESPIGIAEHIGSEVEKMGWFGQQAYKGRGRIEKKQRQELDLYFRQTGKKVRIKGTNIGIRNPESDNDINTER